RTDSSSAWSFPFLGESPPSSLPSPLFRVKTSIRKATRKDILMAKALYQLLGGLPLALDQAGAYIAENGCSLQQYLDLYELYRPKLLDRRGIADHPDSVLMTFWLSWEQIQERSVLAAKALQFCAFLAPDQIPEQFAAAGIVLTGTDRTRDAFEVNEAL